MPRIRVKKFTKEIVALSNELGLTAVLEYRTQDGTRIDVAILHKDRKLIAIEIEASFKWFPQRVLYDIVKAHRAGFSELWVVTPFRGNPRWIKSYTHEIGLSLFIIDEKEAKESLRS